MDILEEAPKGGHQEASKDGHQEVFNLPPFKRKRKYYKFQSLKRIYRLDGKLIKDPREPPSDILHFSLRPYLDGYIENLFPVPTLFHSPKIDSMADSGAVSNIIPTSDFLKMNLPTFDVENHISGDCGESYDIIGG